MADLRASQLAFTAYLRDPATVAPPTGMEPRRLQVYRDLIYNNIEGFVSGGFPVLRSLYRDDVWQALVRDFVAQHYCQTPYFLEISQEFLQYLMQERQMQPSDPPFMAELAHYEWVELALDVALDDFPPASECVAGDVLTQVPLLSPLVWSLSYRYPVHLIGPDNVPDAAPESATYLVVYRNRDEQVQFLEGNAATARLLELLRENTTATGAELLTQLAQELAPEAPEAVVGYGAELLSQFLQLDILAGIRCD